MEVRAVNLLRDALTDADGVSYALVKLLGMLLVLVFIGLSVASFVTAKPFDMLAYGTASGLVVAALGAAIRLAEPKPPEKQP